MQIISIDWLQLYCLGDNFVADSRYEWKLQNYQTKQFRRVHEVIYRGEEFATVVSVPTSPIIPSNAVIVKFKNRQLYGTDIIFVVDLFLKQNGLEFKSITRLDLALDLNSFKNGLLPATFIDKFLRCEFLKSGRGKFTLIGEQKFSNSYQYLRFGQKTADINVYLYNKSVELEQVQDKPYIRKVWKISGLDLNKPIWRLEVSIKGAGTHYIDKCTGESTRIDYLNLNDSNYLSNVFFSYINQYFYFCVNDGTKNKTRMSKLELFKECNASFKPLYLPRVTGSNRTDKIFAKKLYSLDQELRGFNDNMLSVQKELLSEFIIQTDLVEYVNKKKDMWQRSAFRED